MVLKLRCWFCGDVTNVVLVSDVSPENTPTVLTNGQIKTDLTERNYLTSSASFSDSDTVNSRRSSDEVIGVEDPLDETKEIVETSDFLTNNTEEINDHISVTEVDQNFCIKEEEDEYKSVSENGCDQSCNIGAVNITIDTNITS